MSKRTPLLAASVLAISGVLAACGPADANTSGSDNAGGAKPTTLHLVSYSVPKAAYDVATKAFAATSAGKGVTFAASYAASGDQSRAVESGKEADVVNFSL